MFGLFRQTTSLTEMFKQTKQNKTKQKTKKPIRPQSVYFSQLQKLESSLKGKQSVHGFYALFIVQSNLWLVRRLHAADSLSITENSRSKQRERGERSNEYVSVF